MKINNLQTNHIFQPLGWDFSHLHFSWECNDVKPQDSILYTRIRVFKNNFSVSSLVFEFLSLVFVIIGRLKLYF